MLKFEIIITEEEVVLSDAGEAALLSESLKALEAQALAGLDRDGQPIIGRSGKRLDLHGETGELWSKVTQAPAEGGLVFGSDHASVLTKYKADGLNEASQKALEEKLSPTMQDQVTNREVK